MKRVVSLWLPSFATDRLSRRKTPPRSGARSSQQASASEAPLATVTAAHGGVRVVAANQSARAGGVTPGMSLTDARALLPGLAVAEADPAADRQMLERLADWCGRYSPWTAVDEHGAYGAGGGAGLWLDVSSSAHLFGGEQALLDDLVGRFAGLGFAAAAALADTPGAAWAVARLGLADPASPQRSPPESPPPVHGRRIAARHPRSEHPFAGARPAARPNADTPGQAIRIVPPGDAEAALAPLPVAALRLPATVVEGLDRVGLRRAGNLLGLPRAPLAVRWRRCAPGCPSSSPSAGPRTWPWRRAPCWTSCAASWPPATRARGGWSWRFTAPTPPSPAPWSAPAARSATPATSSGCSATSWTGSMPASASR